MANFYNIYDPAQGTVAGVLSLPNFSNPVQFICGGTFDIAQMTHFGVSGMSMLGAMLGLGGSSLSSMLPKAAVAGSGAGAGGSTALSTIKSSMGLPTNNACSSPTGKKAGC